MTSKNNQSKTIKKKQKALRAFIPTAGHAFIAAWIKGGYYARVPVDWIGKEVADTEGKWLLLAVKKAGSHAHISGPELKPYVGQRVHFAVIILEEEKEEISKE